jgi:hypothetical protein
MYDLIGILTVVFFLAEFGSYLMGVLTKLSMSLYEKACERWGLGQ